MDRRRLEIILAPLLLYALLLGVARLWPSFPHWVEQPVLRALPMMLLAAAAGLGLGFMQSRITFCSLLVGTALITAERAGPLALAAPFYPRLLLWSGLFLPAGLAVFHRLRERGIWSAHGAVRFAISALACGFLALLPRLRDWPSEHLVAPVAAWLPFPIAAVVVTVIALPLLFLPKSYESPALGPLMALAGLCALTALGLRASFWPPDRAASVLQFFMSAAGALLVAAVLDSAWRKANTDELTQLPARHALKHHLARLGPLYTVGLIDIDHFKEFNDRHGHAVGDQVLRFVAARLRAHAPGRAYRYGGEEFIIVCEGDRAEAHAVAIEEARRAIGRDPFRLRSRKRPRRRPDTPSPDARRKAQVLRITASAGVAAADGEEEDPLQVIQKADEALYRAKRLGRDRTCQAGKGAR